jgi:hypothetical protein
VPAGQNNKLRRLHRRAWLNIVAAVLITQTKTINIDGQQVKVFSFDGRTWFSKACDLEV